MRLTLSLSIGFTASLLLISPTLAGEIVIVRGIRSTNIINNSVVREDNFTNINRSVIYPTIYPNFPNIIYQNNSSVTYTNGFNNNINGSYTRTINPLGNPLGRTNTYFNNNSINGQIIKQEVSTQNTVTIVNLNNTNLATQPTTPTPVTSIGNIGQNTIIRSDVTTIRRSEIFRALRGFN